MKFTLMVATLMLVLLGCRNPEARAQSARARALETLVSIVDEGQAPGLAYGIAYGDSILWTHVGGFQDAARKSPVTISTTFQLMSVSKLVTAMAVVLLAKEGKVSLDQPLTDVLKDLPYATKPSIRQVLGHLGGIPNPLPIEWVHLYERRHQFNERQFLDSIIGRTVGSEEVPGQKSAYSNLGFYLLGRLVEQASGLPFTTYVEQRIFSRLGLQGTEYIGFEIPDTNNHARACVARRSLMTMVFDMMVDLSPLTNYNDNGWRELRLFRLNGTAYGGCVANLGGLLRFLHFCMSDKSGLNIDDRTALFSAQRTSKGALTKTALGFRVGQTDEISFVFHSGGGPGYYCEARIYPLEGIASAVLTNRTGISEENLLNELDLFFLDEGK